MEKPKDHNMEPVGLGLLGFWLIMPKLSPDTGGMPQQAGGACHDMSRACEWVSCLKPTNKS